MLLKVLIRNIMVCTSDKKQKHFLTAKGLVDCMLKTQKQKLIADIKHEIKQ